MLAREPAGSPSLAPASLLLVALVAEQTMTPLAREFMTPLDEGMVMDMPITVPRASVTESVDDLKARDMVLCRFPEVDMVVGKAGRAETPTDPAPMDMIETMVNFRPREFWPRRKLRAADAAGQGRAVLDALVARACHRAAGRRRGATRLVEQAVGGGARRGSTPPAASTPTTATRRWCASRPGSRRPRSIPPTPPKRGWSRAGAGTSSSSTASCSRGPRRSSRGW